MVDHLSGNGSGAIDVARRSAFGFLEKNLDLIRKKTVEGISQFSVPGKISVIDSYRQESRGSFEGVDKLETCSPFLVDYEKIREDFFKFDLPSDQEKRASEATINQWLLENAGLMSIAQVRQSVVNNLISSVPSKRRVFRPDGYGRAFLTRISSVTVANPLDTSGELVDIPSSNSIEFDLKGVGRVKPSDDDYFNGLLNLEHAFVEYLFGCLIEKIFEYAGAPYKMLPQYAILDTGFNSRYQGSEMPAGITVRRAIYRETVDFPSMGSVLQYKIIEIEMLLRRFGVTSSARNYLQFLRGEDDSLEYRLNGERQDCDPIELEEFMDFLELEAPVGVERINIQCAIEGDSIYLVDFGQYDVVNSFNRPALSPVRENLFRWGGCIQTSDPEFIQPGKHLIKNKEFWDYESINAYSREIVRKFREGEISSKEVKAICDEIIDETTGDW